MLSNIVIDIANNLISTYGSDIILLNTTNTYNVTTGRIEESIDQSDPIKASVESYSSLEIAGLVTAGDLKLTIPNNNLNISLKTKVLFSNNEYNIINIQPTILENKIVLYEVQMRK